MGWLQAHVEVRPGSHWLPFTNVTSQYFVFLYSFELYSPFELNQLCFLYILNKLGHVEPRTHRTSIRNGDSSEVIAVLSLWLWFKSLSEHTKWVAFSDRSIFRQLWKGQLASLLQSTFKASNLWLHKLCWCSVFEFVFSLVTGAQIKVVLIFVLTASECYCFPCPYNGESPILLQPRPGSSTCRLQTAGTRDRIQRETEKTEIG